jgi:autotransporter-associated beta strand protein
MKKLSSLVSVTRRVSQFGILIVILAATTLPSRAILYDANFAYTLNFSGGASVAYTGLNAARAFADDTTNYPTFAAVGQMKYLLKDNFGFYQPYSGSGTLIADASGNQWVLTAAHNWDQTVRNMTFTFQNITYSVDGFGNVNGTANNTICPVNMNSLIQHPYWSRFGGVGVSQGWDVALFRLNKPVAGIAPATLYTSGDEWNQTGYTVGFGRLGTGTTPVFYNNNNYKLAMTNVIDRVTTQNVTTDSRAVYPGGILVSDFDSGSAGNNTLAISGLPTKLGDIGYRTEVLDPAGVIFGASSLSVQTTGEGGTAKGDSGGPTFVKNALTGTYQIAGITSWGLNPANYYDSEKGLYGDLTYMTRISQQVGWINETMAAAYNYSPAGTQAVTGILSGIGGLYQSGLGRLVLSGANDYTGGTLVSSGTLEVANSSALGTGGVTVSGGSLIIDAGVDIQNAITLADTGAAASVIHAVMAGDDLSKTLNVTSSIGGTDTTAVILSGIASQDGMITVDFDVSAAASNDGRRISDVFTLSGVPSLLEGTAKVTFTLELTVSEPLDNSAFIAWLDGSNTWVNAVNGNTGGTLSFVAGAWSPSYGLGTYGVDIDNNKVWAVLNHNSDFAVVPEPGALTLTGLGLGALLALCGRFKTRDAKA